MVYRKRLLTTNDQNLVKTINIDLNLQFTTSNLPINSTREATKAFFFVFMYVWEMMKKVLVMFKRIKILRRWYEDKNGWLVFMQNSPTRDVSYARTESSKWCEERKKVKKFKLTVHVLFNEKVAWSSEIGIECGSFLLFFWLLERESF